MGGTQRLAERAGSGRARELFESSDTRDAIRSFLDRGPGSATFRGA
jgi:hypothetical protein